MMNKALLSGFYFMAVCLLLVTVQLNAQTAKKKEISSMQRLRFGQINRYATNQTSHAETNFLLAGKKLYVIGRMDGAFPVDEDRSSERGVWRQPVKLLNGFVFSVAEDGQEDWALTDSRFFEHNFYAARDGVLWQ